MKVFKFGGASVKDAAGVRNLAEVVKRYGLDDLVIVVSAMGKTTNALEEVVWAWIDGRPTDDKVDALEQVHSEVLHEVAPHDEGAGKLLTNHFHALRAILKHPATKDIDLHLSLIHISEPTRPY